MMKDTILCRELPNSDHVEEFPWNEDTVEKFKLDEWDVIKLEQMEVVWQGDVAYSLESAS